MQTDKDFLIEQLDCARGRPVKSFVVNFSSKIPAADGYRPSFSHFEIVCSGLLPITLPAEGSFPEMKLGPCDVLYLVPGAWVGRRADTERELLVINLHPDGIECYFSHHKPGGADGYSSSRRSYFTASPLDPGGQHILKSFEHYSKVKDFQMQELAFRTFLELIRYSVQNDKGGKNSRTSSTYKMLLQFIRDNCCSGINRKSVALEFGLSPDHITHLFRKYSKSSFNHTLQQYKMERAAEFLRESRINIDQAASLCGFDETSYFIKTFRRFYGMTPTEYREDEFI